MLLTNSHTVRSHIWDGMLERVIEEGRERERDRGRGRGRERRRRRGEREKRKARKRGLHFSLHKA